MVADKVVVAVVGKVVEAVVVGRGSKAASGKVGVPDGYKKCKICEQVLPDMYFAATRAICTDDDRAAENLQRVLRNKWGKHMAPNSRNARKRASGMHRSCAFERPTALKRRSLVEVKTVWRR